MAALQGSYVLESPIVSTDTTLEVAYRDALLRGVANNGVRFIADLGFGFSYPAGPFSDRPAAGAPVSGALVADVAEHANGSAVLTSGQTIGYAGGGIRLFNGHGEGQLFGRTSRSGPRYLHAVRWPIAAAIGGGLCEAASQSQLE
jgi:hypothetical protein